MRRAERERGRERKKGESFLPERATTSDVIVKERRKGEKDGGEVHENERESKRGRERKRWAQTKKRKKKNGYGEKRKRETEKESVSAQSQKRALLRLPSFPLSWDAGSNSWKGKSTHTTRAGLQDALARKRVQ